MRAFAGMMVLFAVGLPASAQDSRRDREEPELVVESGGRTGTCDGLMFSDKGDFAFAVGDDKVVRVWPNGKDGLEADKMKSLRWPAWREQRGGIKALAVSPDGERVAIGGYGLRSSTVAIINRKSGEIEDITYPESKIGENFYAVMSAAFSPDGKAVAFGTGDGSVWLWRKGEKPSRVGKQVATLPNGQPAEYNRIRLVAFLKSGRILSVAQTGQIQAWGLEGFSTTDRDLGKMLSVAGGQSPVFRAVLSKDLEWLAVGGNERDLIVYNLRTEEKKVLRLNEREYIRALAWNHDGSRLAASIGSVPADAQFSMDGDDRIVLFDNPTTGKELSPVAGPANRYRAEAIAFDHLGRLAIANGENHEVIQWDLKNLTKPVSTIRGTGRNLWGARISESGLSIGFQSERAAKPTDPNRQGQGPFQAFDLTKTKQLKNAPDWVEPLTTADGWTVQPDPKNRFIWYVNHAEKKLRFALPIDPDRDEAPRCWAFLPAAKKNQPTQLLVGHYYGCSLFNLTEQGATRKYVYTGHAGEVMSIAPSKDQKWFITCGTDQTVAAWSTDEWNFHPQLGASFNIVGDKLTVQRIDVGSPIWEAGLLEGDQIVLAVVGKGPPLMNRSGKYGQQMGKPEDCMAYLNNPMPGINLHLGWLRNGKLIEQVTSVKRRPLWRFFPSFDDEGKFARDFVIWMWQTSCYLSGTNGDSLVGWQVNHPSLDGTPTFHPARNFQQHFNNDKIAAIMRTFLRDRDLPTALQALYGSKTLAIKFSALEPAPVVIEPAEPKIGPNGLELTIKVNQRGSNPDLLPERVELWVNDFRFDTWAPGGKNFVQKVVIPPNHFRNGDNQITVQTSNRAGGRGEALAMAPHKRSEESPQLLGLFVGVNSYKNSKVINPDGGRAFGDLNSAVNDATTMQQSWVAHAGKGKLFGGGNQTIKILDVDVKRQDILDQLDQAAKKARPEDLFILFLAGHGDYLRPAAEKGEQPKPGVFVYCCPDYDRKAHNQTGLSSEVLIEKLSRIPCRKLVLLDACHSGEAASANMVRQMVATGNKMTIIAACDQQEQAFEHEKFKNGLFTYAIMEALGEKFNAADGIGNDGADGVLEPVEMFQYVRTRLKALLKEAGKDEDEQNPICFPRKPEKFAIGKK